MALVLDVDVILFLHLRLLFLLPHMRCTRMLKLLYLLQVMVLYNMAHIFHLFPDLDNSYLGLNGSYVELGQSQFYLQFPITLPIQMES